MFSIKTRIIIAYTLVFGILLTAFAVVIYRSNRKSALEKLDARMHTYALALQTELEEQFRERGAIDVHDLLAIPVTGLQDSRFLLYDNKGKRVFVHGAFPDMPLRSMEAALNGNAGFSEVIIRQEKYRFMWFPAEVKEDTLYALGIAASLEEVHSDLHRLLLIFWTVLPLALVIAGMTAYLISKSAFRPITRMAATAREISGSSLNRRLQLPAARDEVYLLGETLNEMIGRIDSAFKSQKQFVAGASHELRTPLTIMQTELELALRYAGAPEVSRSIRIALSEIGSLSVLTDSLLVLSRMDAAGMPMQWEMVRLDELLAECIRALQSSATDKAISLQLNVDEAVEITADREKLKRVFINLIDNAIKYSLKSGTVQVKLKKMPNQQIAVIVQDQGPGIPESDREKIFDRFYRSPGTRSAARGSGLGLSIVREFISMHKGKITVESASGEGARFLVELPVRPE